MGDKHDDWSSRDVRALRDAAGLSQARLAAALRALGKTVDRVEPQLDRGTVSRWERGVEHPSVYYRGLLSQFHRRLGALPMPPSGHLLELAAWPALEPADQDYAISIREAVQQLVALDTRFGGNEIAPLASRAFRTVRHRLDTGLYDGRVALDLQAAGGELAEVAGWLLHDADDQLGARRLNQEALFLTRLAGDRSMERLILANMSLADIFDRRPGEALQIARAERCSADLTPRLDVIFTVREARALAQSGRPGGHAASAGARPRGLPGRPWHH